MRKRVPFWIGPRNPVAAPNMLRTPSIQAIRERLVRDAMRSIWQRLADWLDKPVSLTDWS